MSRIRNIIQNFVTIPLGVLALATALPAIYLLPLELNLPVPYIKVSTLHEWIVLAGELLICSILYKIYLRGNWKLGPLLRFLRDFLVVNCVFAIPFIRFYSDPTRSEIPAIHTIQPLILPSYDILLVASVVLVLITNQQKIFHFYHWVRENLHFLTPQNIRILSNWLGETIEAQHRRDEQAEISRRIWFDERHPQLVRIPMLGALAEQASQEGIITTGILSVLIIAGLAIRLWHLGDLSPYADELNHLLAAKTIFQGLPLSQVVYTRSLYTVTLPVVLSFKLFGLSLWSARFVGVLVNMLALIPLYLLCKKINKPVAVIAVALYVSSPWMIAIARNVREYGYYPFFFYSVAYVFVMAYEAIPDRLVLNRDYRYIFNWKILLYLGTLCSVLYFATQIDRLSTFKLIFALYPVAGVLLLRKIDWRVPENRKISLIILATLGAGFIVLLASTGGKYLQIRSLNIFFLSLFFERAPQQWYYMRPLVPTILLVSAILATSFRQKKLFVQPFIVLVYFAYQLSFLLFNIKDNRPRYASIIEYWHILMIAIGLYASYMLLGRVLNYRYRRVTAIALVLVFWNVPQSILPVMPITTRVHPITDEYHLNFVPTLSYLQSHRLPGDVLVTTTYIDRYFQWVGATPFNEEIFYDYSHPKTIQDIFNAIGTYPCGWIALDYPRGYFWSQPVPLKDFTYAGKQVEYLGWFADVFILRWDDRSCSSG